MGALAFCEPGTLFYEIILAAGSSPKQLRENYGAVGDILFQLLDKEGNLIQDSPLEKKFKNCSINPEILKRMGNPELQKPVVILSSGARRAEAILAGLRGGYLNTVLIDHHLGQELLSLDERV
jgi:DNA-binding transcriptional regulator LsrR (DeoR family)